MLKSHQTDDPGHFSSDVSPDRQARVTPEELSQALAAIEARKQAAASRLAGTIPIDQAVSELGLDSSPEEILAEVNAQRARAARTSVAPTGVTPERRQGRAQEKYSPGKNAVGVAVAVSTLAALVIISPLHRHTPLVSHETRTLPAAPDGAPLFGDLGTVHEIADGAPPAQVRVHLGDDFRNSWRLVKHGDQLYVQAYTLPVTEQAIKAGRPFRLYNNNDVGQIERKHYTAITLPLKSLHWDDSRSTDEGWGEITVSQVRPDSHVWEKW